MKLQELGWNTTQGSHFHQYVQLGFIPGRIVSEHKHMYRLHTEYGEVLGQVAGKIRHQAQGRADYPAVGDWVAVSPHLGQTKTIIHAILPRFSKFSRKVAGATTEEQIVAANFNDVLLVSALNNDFNLRRLERYLTLAWESGANPVVVLNKADLCKDLEQKLLEVQAIALGVPVYAVSCYTGQGLKELSAYVKQGHTIALLGSSGVGKSTLINYLAGQEIRQVQEVREGDDRGRHTTTSRELIVLSGGGMVIDTPGMREIQLWGGEEGLQDAFEDIHTLANGCRFNDCQHLQEPGCAVMAALDQGVLDQARYDNFMKLQKEVAYQARRENQQELRAEKQRWKQIHKDIKEIYKRR